MEFITPCLRKHQKIQISLLANIFWISRMYHTCSCDKLSGVRASISAHRLNIQKTVFSVFSVFRNMWKLEILQQQVKKMLGTPAPPIQVSVWTWLLCFLLMHPGRLQVNAQVHGSLPPTWATHMEFWAPGFRLIHSSLWQTFSQGVSHWMEGICLYISSCTHNLSSFV